MIGGATYAARFDYVLHLKEQISNAEVMALLDRCKEIFEIKIT